jgi:hypothetical protein
MITEERVAPLSNLSYTLIKWCVQEGRSPSSLSLPLSFEGEGDKGGEVNNMIDKRIDRFPEGVLEHVSKIIGENRTGSEISELIRNAGYLEKSGLTGTKWRYLYDLFKEFNNKPNGQLHIAKIVQLFCSPTQWIERESDRKNVINKINEGLIYTNLQVNTEGKIVITGNIIQFEENHILDTSTQSKEMLVTPVFRTRDIKLEDDLCFVLMPFQPSFERLFKEKIKPTVESCGLRCTKANDLFSPTPILEDIWTHIFKSKVIIADVTGRNPNVFYEIGIAHTIGKPVILITQDREDIPFDIAQIRYFQYTDDSTGWENLCYAIHSSIQSILRS